MQTYYVDEKIKAEHVKLYKKALIKKHFGAYAFAMLFFSLPIIIPVILFLINPSIVGIIFFFVEALIISTIAIPFGLVCYSNVFKYYVWNFRKRTNESITFHKDYLEHIYDFNGERFIFTIEYNTILDSMKDTEFSTYIIDSPYFIRNMEYATQHFKGDVRKVLHVNVTHELPLYFDNMQTIIQLIEKYCQENEKNNRTRTEILIEKGEILEEELKEDEI